MNTAKQGDFGYYIYIYVYIYKFFFFFFGCAAWSMGS